MASCVHTIDFGTSPSDDVDDDDNMLKLLQSPLAIRIERKWNLKTFRASKSSQGLVDVLISHKISPKKLRLLCIVTMTWGRNNTTAMQSPH